jgi:hypothetical protein
MSDGKISTNERPLQSLLDDLQQKVNQNGLKDLEIMEKFCSPASYPLSNTDDIEVEVPALVKKLVDVEYMLQGKEMP